MFAVPRWLPRRIAKWLEPDLFQPFVFGVLISITISEFARGALTLALLPTYGKTVLHFAVEWTALAISLQYLVDNVLRSPAGWLVDRIGPRFVLLPGFAVACGGIFWMMHAKSIGTLLAGAAVYGVGVTPMWPSAVTSIGLATPEDKRASFMGYLYIFWLAGTGLGPVLINLVIGATYHAAFWLLFCVEAGGFGLAWLLVRRPHLGGVGTATSRLDGVRGETEVGAPVGTRVAAEASAARRGKDARTASDRMDHTGYVAGAAAAGATGPVGAGAAAAGAIGPGAAGAAGGARQRLLGRLQTHPAYWRDLWRNIREVAFLFPGMFVQTFAVSSLVPVLSIYAKVVLNISGAMYSMILVAGGIFTVGLLLPAGHLVDKFGPRRFIVPGFLLAGAGLGLYPLYHSIPFTFVTVAWLGCCYAFILPAWNAVLDRSIDKDKKGTLWGIFMSVEGLGSAMGPYLGGLLWDRVSPVAPFWVSAGVIMAMGLLYIFMPLGPRGSRGRGGAVIRDRGNHDERDRDTAYAPSGNHGSRRRGRTPAP